MTTTPNGPTKTPPTGSPSEPGKLATTPQQWIAFIAEPSRQGWSDTDITVNGLRTCSKCRTPKEYVHDLKEHGTYTAPCYCECSLAAIKAEREGVERIQAEQWKQRVRESAFRSPELAGYTMAADDTPDSPYSKFINKYVEQWDRFRQEGIGMILSGGVGTGKTYYAAAIVNAVIDKGDRAYFVTVPDVVEAAWNKEDWHKLLAKVDHYELLVLDDLGAERETDYAIQQVFSVINRRLESGLPLIVTTNLTLEEMKTRPTLESKRIYDRIADLCPLDLELRGSSRRTPKGQSRKDRAREIMQGRPNT